MSKAQYMPLLAAINALTTRVPEGKLQLTVLQNRIAETYPKIDQKRGLLNAVVKQVLHLPVTQQVCAVHTIFIFIYRCWVFPLLTKAAFSHVPTALARADGPTSFAFGVPGGRRFHGHG